MTSIVDKTRKYVVNTLNEKLSPGYLYHNYNHTQRVSKYVKELIEAEDLNEEESEILELAALLHDIGYIESPEDHEEISAGIAIQYLRSIGYDERKAELVAETIKATAAKVEPASKLQKMLVDADFSHLASRDYSDISELLREELKILRNKSFTDLEWVELNIKMFNEHHKFYTFHAIENWQPQKSQNLISLLKQQKKLREREESVKTKSAEIKRKNKKTETPERGIETMYRVSLRNHINLSSIADTKANILLSVNAIIISLVLSNLLPKLDNSKNAYLIIPTIIFISFSVASMVMSILATRPNVTEGKFTKEDVLNKKVNLLFFGNFHKMSLNDFEWAMKELMKDKEYLYNSLSKDLYFLGLVLDRKYRLLRITYTIFMTGIIVSVIAFAIASKNAV